MKNLSSDDIPHAGILDRQAESEHDYEEAYLKKKLARKNKYERQETPQYQRKIDRNKSLVFNT